MVRKHGLAILTALWLLGLLPLTFGLGHDSHATGSMAMGTGMPGGEYHMASISSLTLNLTQPVHPSYFSRSEFSGLLLAHIVIMTIAWFFILPIGELHYSRLNQKVPRLTCCSNQG